MPRLSKIQTGFMYEETFNNSGIVWQPFPQTDNFIADGTNFKLYAGNERQMILTSLPAEDFVMQVKIQHQPLSFNNFAGVVVVKDKDSWVECRSYRDEETEKAIIQLYQYIKIVKKIDNFIFYGSIQGRQWEMIGSCRMFDANLIGFYIESDEPGSFLTIEEVKMYKTPVITFLGVEPQTRVIIKRPSGANRVFHVVQDGTKVDFDLISDSFPYRDHTVQIISPAGEVLINEQLDEISGGDVFDLTYNIELLFNETITGEKEVLEPGDIIDLGQLQGATGLFSLTVINRDDYQTIMNSRLRIEQFSEYNRGHKFATLALEEREGVPGEWVKELSIERLEPNVPVKVFFKIEKDTSPVYVFSEDKYKFRVIVE